MQVFLELTSIALQACLSDLIEFGSLCGVVEGIDPTPEYAPYQHEPRPYIQPGLSHGDKCLNGPFPGQFPWFRPRPLKLLRLISFTFRRGNLIYYVHKNKYIFLS